MKLPYVPPAFTQEGTFVRVEIFEFTVNGKTTKVTGRENLTPEQKTLVEASEKQRKSSEEMLDAWSEFFKKG